MRQPYLISATFYVEHISMNSLAKLGIDKQTKLTKLVYAKSYEEATQRFGEAINEAMVAVHQYRKNTYARVARLTYTNETIQ